MRCDIGFANGRAKGKECSTKTGRKWAAEVVSYKEYNMAMLPEFDERGNLPRGIHCASLKEIIERFGQGSELRQVQGESLEWLVPLCKSAGIIRLLINGSFVTNASDPNDVDCLLLQGPAYHRDSTAAQQLLAGLPFLELKIGEKDEFELYAEVIFGSDRDLVSKGIVEVDLADI
jgi:hypothetical protein